MTREAEHAGIEMSVRELLDSLEGSKRPCCSIKANADGPGPGGC